MRILIDALSVIPGVTGGQETYTVGLVKALSEVAPQNQYLVLMSPISQHLFAGLGDNVSLRPVRINTRLRPVRALYEQLWLPVLARRWTADVVHFPGNLISLACAWLGVPTVVTIHDMSTLYYLAHFPAHVPRAKRRILISLTRYAARHSQAVVTVSNFSRREIRAHTGGMADNIFVVYSGCPHDGVVKADPAEALRRLVVTRPYVLAVGRTDKHKNLDLFVRAFAEAKRDGKFPHQLVLAGPVGSGHSDLMASIDESRAHDFVRWIGYVQPDDLPALYQSADWFAMPSLYEGFGFPVLEAMQHGVPTIISKAASLPEVGGDATVYMEPRDVTSMAATLGKVLTDHELRCQLRERGKAQAAKFSWHQTAREMIDVFQKVMDEAKKRQRH